MFGFAFALGGLALLALNTAVIIWVTERQMDEAEERSRMAEERWLNNAHEYYCRREVARLYNENYWR
jgi:hypothetical protein